MKRFGWQIILGTVLVYISIGVYLLHYAIFHDVYNIFFYMIMDIAFLPIQVLLVTMIIHQLLSFREKRKRMDKLNMVIGAFFSEIGTKLLTYVSDCDPKLDIIRNDLIVREEWSDGEFTKVSRRLKAYDYAVDVQKVNLEHLRNLLSGKLDFLLRLLENPILLEHESFTDLLWAVFHLGEELASRQDIAQLPKSDYEHLAGDTKRVYNSLVHQWLDYMRHLKNNYPYLFSLAMRTNPFDQTATPIVR